MKILRVPWIQCRADEVGAQSFPWEWKGRHFEIMAFSELEARYWWRGLSESERNQALGIAQPHDEPSWF